MTLHSVFVCDGGGGYPVGYMRASVACSLPAGGSANASGEQRICSEYRQTETGGRQMG